MVNNHGLKKKKRKVFHGDFWTLQIFNNYLMAVKKCEGKLHVMSSGLLNTNATIILPCSGGWLCYAHYIGDRG